jgi:hypothetical protein
MPPSSSGDAITNGSLAPPIDKPSIVIELALAGLTAHLFICVILRKYYLRPLGLQSWSHHAALLALLLPSLLVLRAWRNSHRGSDVPAGWRPGQWLEGLRGPDLVLTASFLFSLPLTLLEASSAHLGPDSDLFVGQLHLAFLGRVIHADLEPGPMILWSPFYVAAHILTLLAHSLGAQVAADGLSLPYLNAVRLGSLVCAFAAAILTHRACRRFFDPWLSAFCVVGVWLASPLVYYSVFEPGMAHAPAAAAASLFVLLWLRVREDPTRHERWLGMAFAGVLLLSMQKYEVYFLVAPTVTVLAQLRAKTDGAARRSVLLASLVAFGLCFLAFIPFLVMSLRMPGYLLGRALLYWNKPYIAQLLFSSNGGLFAWTPIAYLGVVGLFFLFRRDRAVAVTLFLTLALGVYLLASTGAWSAGWSFGSRRLTEAFPILALGFCALAEWGLERPWLLGSAALAGLIFWNLSLAFQVHTGALPQGTTVSFTKAGQNAVEQFYEHVGNPSSFPASWIFALAYRVRPDRFDLLFGETAFNEMAIALGSPQDGTILGRGWSAPSHPPGGAPCRWSIDQESTLIVPLRAPVGRRLRLQGAASRTPEHRSQTVAILVNGESPATLTVPRRSTVFDIDVPARFWKTGLNVIMFRYAWTQGAREGTTGGPVGSAWRLERVELAPLAESGPSPPLP